LYRRITTITRPAGRVINGVPPVTLAPQERRVCFSANQIGST
jgi:hypothetical protein